MLIATIAMPAFAADVTVGIDVESAPAAVGDVFNANVYITGLDSLRIAQFTVGYDPTKLQPVKNDGTEASTVPLARVTDLSKIEDEETGGYFFTLLKHSINSGLVDVTYAVDTYYGADFSYEIDNSSEKFSVLQLRFKVLELGDTGLRIATSADGDGKYTKANPKGYILWPTADEADIVASATIVQPNLTIGGGEEPEPDTYKVIYNVDGNEGLIVDDNEYAEGDEVTVTTQVPSREGYNFLGWSRTEGATTAEYVGGDTFTMGAEDVTLYAVWQKKVYTVTFIADGDLVATLNVEHGGSVDPDDIPQVPAKAGFTGVWEEADLTNITENITVNAVYTAVEGSAIAVRSATVKQGASTSVDITVNDIPETAKGMQYIVEYDAEAYDSIELDLSSKFDATYSKVDDDGEGIIAVMATLNGDATLEDGDVVATINLRAKTDTEPGAYTIAIINPRYGDGGVFDATPIENVSNGTITVEAAEDPKLPAAEDAVKAFEDAVEALQAKALESLTADDIADAEGLKTAAEAAVAELNADISEDAIVALTNRITAAYSELQAVEDKLEAFENVNALAFDINDLNVLDVEVADAANINSYKLAVEVTQKRLDKEVLTVAEIQAAITEADAELVAIADGDSVLGNVNGSTSGTVDVNDVIMIKNYLLGDIPLTVAQAIRADMDKDGQLLATDTTNVLLKAIEDLRKSVAGV